MNDTRPTEPGLAQALEKMRAAGADDAARTVFAHYYRLAATGETGLIPEETISPLTDVERLADVDVDETQAHDALAQTVMIKLNGGLGTSMGLDRAKTLLPVRDGQTFLDLIVAQVRHARERYDVRLPLLFMNSFRTRADTLTHLERYPDLAADGLPVDFLQSAEPKIRVDGLVPVTWPADPTLEWCPPGHGEVYTRLASSGVLDALLERGYRYLTIANGDNLGAAPDPRLAGWFAATDAPTPPKCAFAPRTTVRADTSPSAAATANSSSATPPKRRPTRCTTSPTNTATDTFTATTCGSTCNASTTASASPGRYSACPSSATKRPSIPPTPRPPAPSSSRPPWGPRSRSSPALVPSSSNAAGSSP